MKLTYTTRGYAVTATIMETGEVTALNHRWPHITSALDYVCHDLSGGITGSLKGDSLATALIKVGMMSGALPPQVCLPLRPSDYRNWRILGVRQMEVMTMENFIYDTGSSASGPCTGWHDHTYICALGAHWRVEDGRGAFTGRRSVKRLGDCDGTCQTFAVARPLRPETVEMLQKEETALRLAAALPATTYVADVDARIRRSYDRLGKLLNIPHAPDVVIAVESAQLFEQLALRYGPQVWTELGRRQIARWQRAAGYCPYHADSPTEVALIVEGEGCCAACVEADRAMEKEL